MDESVSLPRTSSNSGTSGHGFEPDRSDSLHSKSVLTSGSTDSVLIGDGQSELDDGERQPVLRRTRTPWMESETEELVKGMHMYGKNWKLILSNYLLCM